MFSVSPIWSKYISVALLFGICLHNAEANRKCLPMIGFLLCGHNKKAGLLSFFVLLLYVVVMMMLLAGRAVGGRALQKKPPRTHTIISDLLLINCADAVSLVTHCHR